LREEDLSWRRREELESRVCFRRREERTKGVASAVARKRRGRRGRR